MEPKEHARPRKIKVADAIERLCLGPSIALLAVGEPTFEAQMDQIKKDGLKFYWTGAGDIDQAHDRMVAPEGDVKSKGIPTSYKEIPGRHYWFLWRDFLSDYTALIFKE